MKAAQHIAALAGLITASIASAQFPLVGTSTSTLYTIRSLDVGIRFVESFESPTLQRTIFNQDLSVYRVLNYPPPPAGMTWSNMSYITEALFDTDPSTIEFVMVAGQEDGPGDFAVFVFREDGAQLFTQNPGNIVGGLGIGFTSFEPIYTVNGQTYMVVYEDQVWGPPSRIYALPGTLPCIDCFGSPGSSNIGLGGGLVADPASGITLFPNPAREQLTIGLGPTHSGAGMVRLVDDRGRVVLERPFAAAEQVQVNVGALAHGAYVCQVLVGGKLLSSLPLVVER